MLFRYYVKIKKLTVHKIQSKEQYQTLIEFLLSTLLLCLITELKVGLRTSLKLHSHYYYYYYLKKRQDLLYPAKNKKIAEFINHYLLLGTIPNFSYIPLVDSISLHSSKLSGTF